MCKNIINKNYLFSVFISLVFVKYVSNNLVNVLVNSPNRGYRFILHWHIAG